MTRRHRLAREDGFTLVELLVSTSVSLILVFAALLSFDMFNSGAGKASRLTNAQDAARRDTQRIVGVLRNAGAPAPVSGAQPTTVIQALPNDLVFRTSAWPGESSVDPGGVHIARLCLDTTTKTLWFDGLRAGTSGPATPGSACPSTATGWTHKVMSSRVINNAANPVFRYTGSATVRSVGLSLRLEGGSTAKSRPLVVQSGSALRGALAPVLNATDITKVSCEDGYALLSINPAAGQALKLSAPGGITAGAGKVLVAATGTLTNISITISDALGLVQTLLKPVSCP